LTVDISVSDEASVKARRRRSERNIHAEPKIR
jgi:hypothetical protein